MEQPRLHADRVATTTGDAERSVAPGAFDAAGAVADGVLDGVRPGDAVVIVGLVAAPALQRTVTPEADSVLRDSLRRILEEAVPADGRVLRWLHGQFLAVLPCTPRAQAVAVAGEVRRRWHCSWTAPVAVASGVSAVDAATPVDVATMLAGAELSAAKERAAHA